MADLSYDDVRKIISIIDASSLDEIHVEIGDFKLDVRRRTAGEPAPSPPPPPASAAPQAAAQPAAVPPAAKPAADIALGPGQYALTAPMLGTFYRAPSPEAPPFVDVGSVVAAGDALCIIEVMKLMNTIKAERAGRVVQIAPQNATMVEFGQTLIVFEPA